MTTEHATTADCDCDHGTLVTAPECFDHMVQCVEKCDTCGIYSTDADAAQAVASRIRTQRTYCGRKAGCDHWVIAEHATHTPGPMESIVRRDAYIGESDSILQAAIKADTDRTALLAALEGLLHEACTEGADRCLRDAHGIARDALAQAKGEMQ